MKVLTNTEANIPKNIPDGTLFIASDTGNVYLGTEGGNVRVRDGNVKEYVAYVVYANDTPTVLVGRNTLGITPVWSNPANGVVRATTTGLEFTSTPLNFAVSITPLTAEVFTSFTNSSTTQLDVTGTDAASAAVTTFSFFINLTLWA